MVISYVVICFLVEWQWEPMIGTALWINSFKICIDHCRKSTYVDSTMFALAKKMNSLLVLHSKNAQSSAFP